MDREACKVGNEKEKEEREAAIVVKIKYILYTSTKSGCTVPCGGGAYMTTFGVVHTVRIHPPTKVKHATLPFFLREQKSSCARHIFFFLIKAERPACRQKGTDTSRGL